MKPSAYGSAVLDVEELAAQDEAYRDDVVKAHFDEVHPIPFKYDELEQHRAVITQRDQKEILKTQASLFVRKALENQMNISFSTQEIWKVCFIFDRDISIYRDECEVE